MGIKNVVFVHGAWADGSCWSKVIPILQASGLHTVAVQNPLNSLADDAASTNRLINAQDGPVLLVGHSYGGVVITEAGLNPKVAGLVYVAAFAPDTGESGGGLASGYPPTPIFSQVLPVGDNFLMLSAKAVHEDFAQDLPEAEREMVLAVQGATNIGVLGTPITKAAWHERPNWFVVAEHDRAIQPQQEADTAKRMGAKVLSLPSSHLPMLSHAEEVAAFVIEAAGSIEISVAA
jgi:pimeloyl-ACP methyl ester carboxylesterase